MDETQKKKPIKKFKKKKKTPSFKLGQLSIFLA